MTALGHEYVGRLDVAVDDSFGMRRGQPNMFLAFDRKGIDPFKDRFEITLRYEGTVRGVGGLAIDEACATTVPGLFAAGDAASRENMVGASSGGGGPNATWAMASGVWSGRSAAEFAGKIGRAQARRATAAAGRIGLAPAEKPDEALTAGTLIAAVQQEILPIGQTFFRTEAGLRATKARLDNAWNDARAHLQVQSAPTAELVRVREAVAMLATARFIVTSAIERRETRGLNRRLDFPQTDPAQAHRLLTGGLDRVWVRHATAERAMAS